MFRCYLVSMAFVAALAVTMLSTGNSASGQQFIIGPYFFDDTPPRAGYYYPGVPFANAYVSPYYRGYGPPSYPGYGPPYTRNWGREYLFPRYPTYVTPYMATNRYYGYYGY